MSLVGTAHFANTENGVYQRRFTGAGRPHHGDTATRVTDLLDGRRPHEPQMTMSFHGREPVAAQDHLLRRRAHRYLAQRLMDQRPKSCWAVKSRLAVATIMVPIRIVSFS